MCALAFAGVRDDMDGAHPIKSEIELVQARMIYRMASIICEEFGNGDDDVVKDYIVDIESQVKKKLEAEKAIEREKGVQSLRELRHKIAEAEKARNQKND
jgi:hypothetical protein